MKNNYRTLVGGSADDIKTLSLYEGHIIRFDDSGANVFIFIENGEMSEYRWVGSDKFGRLGRLEEGMPFILWQKTTDTEKPMSLFFPAVPKSLLSEQEVAERNRRAKERIKPLDDLKVESY